jgi:hypothetical protein
MDRVVGGKFKLGRKIGCGSFGEIYLGDSFIHSFPYPAAPPIPSVLASLTVCCVVLGLTDRAHAATAAAAALVLQPRTSTPTRSSPSNS